MNLPNKPRQFRGFKMHGDISAADVGARTPDQQNEDAQQIAELTDPVTGGILPQNRLKKYGGGSNG